MGTISKQKSTECRPKYIPETDRTDYFLRITGFVIIVFVWLTAVYYYYYQLPEIISVHFNLKGEMDRMGSKNHLLLIPLIASILFIFLSILLKFPDKFNYPMPITFENAQKQYKRGIRLIRWLNISLGIIFNSILWMMYDSAQSIHNKWILPIIAIVVLLTSLPLIIYLSSSK